MLVVNTASKCGPTTQYAQLEELYTKYRSANFTILGFPANNFFRQEPGTNAEIQAFCTKNYGVTFQMMAKYNNITNNTAIRELSNVNAIWQYDPTRFVTFLTLALNYSLGGIVVFGYHLVNLAIHILTALLVWWFGRLLFATPALKDKKNGFAEELIPLFLGLLFVAHPVQTQAVTYIVQRAASLAALFYVGSAALYIKYRLTENKTAKKYVIYFR